jgi:hypothetical protein
MKDIGDFLEQVQARIEDLPLPWAVICKVYETSGGFIGISSRSTTGFTVGLNAAGMPHIAVKSKAQGGLRLGAAHGRRRVFSLSSEGPEEGRSETERPARRRHSVYTPLFNEGFRVCKSLWPLLGRPELVAFDGHPAPVRIERSDPVDLLYDSSRAEVSLEEIRSMSVDDLFEAVTPELISEEVSVEINSELIAAEMDRELTPQMLIKLGVKKLDSASVAGVDISRIRKRVEATESQAEVAAEEEDEKKPTRAH